MQSLAPPSRSDFMLLRGLAEQDCMSAAARAAGMSRPAAVRRISLLERRYAITLVAESAEEDARLTKAGWALMSAGRRLLRALDGVLLAVAQAAPEVAALPMLRMASFWLDWARLADDLVVRVPGLLLDITTGRPGQCLELFTDRTVDAAYLSLISGVPPALGRPSAVDVVVDEPLWVALPADHRLASAPQVSLSALADERWLVEAGSEPEALLRRACRGVLEPRIGHVADSPAQLRSLIGLRRGVALVSPVAVPPGDRGGFVIRPLAGAPARRQVLVSDTTVVRAPLAAALVECLRYSYAEIAQCRNPAYRESAAFPFPVRPLGYAPTVTDGELLAGLAVRPGRPVTPRAGCRLEPDDLHMLRMVSQCGSLNRAAPLLLITQPALTRRIGRLEERLGLELLVRGRRGTALAPVARRLLDRLADPQGAVESVLRGDAGSELVAG
jgi:DNA-binding transcriptional LysR family regulator